MPDGFGFIQAAALPMAIVTAYSTLEIFGGTAGQTRPRPRQTRPASQRQHSTSRLAFTGPATTVRRPPTNRTPPGAEFMHGA
jgi:hypothetical protein